MLKNVRKDFICDALLDDFLKIVKARKACFLEALAETKKLEWIIRRQFMQLW